ncbi:hypothetical protein ATCC90586_011117 [Pythium insidiosum]|nr:hypothetical protein ATCC90586_011117 [Pythium insidiosum]
MHLVCSSPVIRLPVLRFRLSAEETLRQREAQSDEARAELRDLRQQLRSAWAGEEDALRRCNYIDEQLDTCKAALETARRELAAHSQCADHLAAAHAEVSSLEEQLLVARGRTTPVDTLSADQARHVYHFVWRHGCGQGDEELWAQLVHACATNDPLLAPLDSSVSIFRSRRGTRLVHPSPDGSLIDRLLPAPQPDPSAAPVPTPAPTGGSRGGASAADAGASAGDQRLVDAPGSPDFGDDVDMDQDGGGSDADVVLLQTVPAGGSAAAARAVHFKHKVSGVALQLVKDQTPFFPNYEPVRRSIPVILER